MIAQFSLRLICGMSLMWCIMPRSQVTAGFFRIQMFIVLALSVLAAMTYGSLGSVVIADDALLSHTMSVSICAGLGVLAYVGSVVWTLNRRQGGTWFVFLIAGISTLLLLAGTIPSSRMASLIGLFSMLSELSTAVLLGGAMTGMLLGHWYLTAPTMSTEPLNRLTLHFAIAAFLRLVLSSIGLWLAWELLTDQTHWLWLALRWIAGVVGPIVVAAMVWRILKLKNTQAATGVLFVAVILTLIGELTASLLYRELLMPL